MHRRMSMAAVRPEGEVAHAHEPQQPRIGPAAVLQDQRPGLPGLGINLTPGKEALVRSRLMKRLRSLGLQRVEDYLAFIDSDEGASEMACLIDVMTTNKTSFFREAEHFHYLRDRMLPGLTAARVRFWSAACSSGEEPYSLAMLICEHVAGVEGRDVRILATDISHRMLEKARGPSIRRVRPAS
jgi:chemotaxis protein methyltransferase CheR